MISATGNRSVRKSGRAGFTLIEIVLVLGLIAVATTILITNFAAIIDRGDSLTAEETLTAAVRRARFIAASERTSTQLHFDKESNSLIISIDGNEVETFTLDDSFKVDNSAEIRFYLIASSEGMGPIMYAADARWETKVVRFAADRSSSPFVAEIDLGSGTPERLQFDPFSSLVITSK
jgi:prepilin-type N-terminal cleavage/methylation domain-containing protein